MSRMLGRIVDFLEPEERVAYPELMSLARPCKEMQ